MRYKSVKELEEEEAMEQEVHVNNTVFNNNTLDMSRRRCTDMKSNRRVFMPRARPVKEECTIRTHKEAWKSEWTRCLKEECRNRGSQDHHQLDPEEMAGCTRLLKETYISPLMIKVMA